MQKLLSILILCSTIFFIFHCEKAENKKTVKNEQTEVTLTTKQKTDKSSADSNQEFMLAKKEDGNKYRIAFIESGSDFYMYPESVMNILISLKSLGWLKSVSVSKAVQKTTSGILTAISKSDYSDYIEISPKLKIFDFLP